MKSIPLSDRPAAKFLVLGLVWGEWDADLAEAIRARIQEMGPK
jgi:hypothetical protein